MREHFCRFFHFERPYSSSVQSPVLISRPHEYNGDFELCDDCNAAACGACLFGGR